MEVLGLPKKEYFIFLGEALIVGHSTSERLLCRLNPSLDSCSSFILARGAKTQAEG